MITVWIDELTPCLKNLSTGEDVPTKVVRIKSIKQLAGYNKHSGWFVNWQKLYRENDIYALLVCGEPEYQGLIAIRDDPDPSINAAFIVWMVASPQCRRIAAKEHEAQKYAGVGGHLFAFAGKYSQSHGHDDGAVYGVAANKALLEHYVNHIGARSIGRLGTEAYRFLIYGKAMSKLEEVYTYDYSEV